jgi:hypothetical protein
MEDLSRNKPAFGSSEYLELKENFMRNYGETFPSEYWREVIGLAFDDNWKGSREWAKPKLVPTPIKFTYEGVELGRETFALPDMLKAKTKFIASHERALSFGERTSIFHSMMNRWRRVLTVTFDEVWKGERLDDWVNLEYTPCDEMLRIRAMFLKNGGKDCGYPGCCNPAYKGPTH